MQFRNSLQASLEDLLPGFHRKLLLDQVEEVVRHVLVHKDALVGDGIPRQPEVCMLAQSRSYDLIEVREYFSWNVLQNELVTPGSKAPLVQPPRDVNGKDAQTLPTTHGQGAAFLGSVLSRGSGAPSLQEIW